MMALMRLLLPDINIPATTAMETLHPRGRLLALESGANVVMPNVTEGDYRKFYELYPGKICTGDTPDRCRGCIQAKIESIGRTVSPAYGFHGDYLKGKNNLSAIDPLPGLRQIFLYGFHPARVLRRVTK